MTIDLTDTTTGAINDALRQARLRLGGVASGMVLTLVIVTNEGEQYDAVRAASAAGRQHPCRILVVIIRRPEPRSRLDAEIRVGETSPGETVLLRMYGLLGQHADSVVAPLLLPDTPVVTWWPDIVPPIPAQDPMGALAQRRITDTAAASSPREALARLAAGYHPGDTDLAWTRATPWRSLLAATMDQPSGAVTGGTVSAEAGNPSADLIAAWLSRGYGVEVASEPSAGPGITEVTIATGDGEIVITRPDGRVAHLRRPGQPERRVALHRRETTELLEEELRRLDPDDVYAETLARLQSTAAASTHEPS
jgi:glucose-6-phosphate dehydrogenase assembly protein OpcA